MKKKLIYLDKKKFNLMLERMDNRVNYDESINLKKKILITEGEGGIGKIIRGFLNSGKFVADEVAVVARALSGDVDELKKLLRRLDDDPQGFKVSLNNSLVDLGVSASALKGLENFIDNVRIVEKSKPEDVYTNLFYNLSKDGKTVDEAVKEIDKLWDDMPEVLKRKTNDIDFPLQATDDIRINIIKNRVGMSPKLPMNIRIKIGDDIAKQATKGLKKLQLDEMLKGVELKSPISEYVVLTNKTSGNHIIVHKNNVGGFVNKFEIVGSNKFEISDGVSFRGKDGDTIVVMDDLNFKSGLSEEELAILKNELKGANSMEKTEELLAEIIKNQRLNERAIAKVKRNKYWVYSILGIEWALEALIQTISCITKEDGELRRVRKDKMEQFLDMEYDMETNPNTKYTEKDLLQFTEPVDFLDCFRTFMNTDLVDVTDRYDPKGYFEHYFPLPLWGVGSSIIDYLFTFSVDLQRLLGVIDAKLKSTIKQQVNKLLKNKNLVEILNHKCEYTKEEAFNLIKNEGGDNNESVKDLSKILNVIGVDGEFKNNLVQNILSGNEALALTKKEVDDMKDGATKDINVNVDVSGWDGIKNGKGIDLASKLIRKCQATKAELIITLLNAAGENEVERKLNDLILFTDGSVSKDEIKTMAKDIGKGKQIDLGSKFTVSNGKKNTEEGINLMGFAMNYGTQRKTDIEGPTVARKYFQDVNKLASDEFIDKQFNALVDYMKNDVSDDNVDSTTTRNLDLGVVINFDLTLPDYEWQSILNNKSVEEGCNIMKATMYNFAAKSKFKPFISMLSPDNEGELYTKHEDVNGNPSFQFIITDETLTELAKLPVKGWCDKVTANGERKGKTKSDCTSELIEFAKTLPCYVE